MSLVQTAVIPEDGEKSSSHWKKILDPSVRLEDIFMLPFRGGSGEEHSTIIYGINQKKTFNLFLAT